MLQASFLKVQVLLRERAGIVIESGKEYLVQTRLAPLVQSRGFGSIDALCCALTGEIADEVLEAMTTNETSFFRDQYPFEAIREAALPATIARNHNCSALSIWCAACSTGQEPYSVAMLIREHFPLLANWRVDIYATDISRQVLCQAKAGHYSESEVARGLALDLRKKYFVRESDGWTLCPTIRNMVRFGHLNLADHWPNLPTFDIIMIRNVLIYFDQATKQQLLTRAGQQLVTNGYLFLGGGESMPPNLTIYERMDLPRSGGFRRRA